MKALSLLLLFIVLSLPGIKAQSNRESVLLRPDKNISLNFAGYGSIISLNYEKFVINKPHFFLAAGIGAGYNFEFKLFNDSQSDNFFTLPHHLTANIGKRNNYLEAGLGGTCVLGNTDRNYYLYPMLGYRYQSNKWKKANFRLFLYYPLMEVHDILFGFYGIEVGLNLNSPS